MNSQNQNNIYPKSCTYGCNTQIYWNTSVNGYWEVFSQKKHLCPNRQQQSKPTTTTTTTPNTPTVTTNTKPNYYANYNKFANKQLKPKMSNSFELLQGSIAEVQKKYEILSDIVSEYNGKVHGSQSQVNGNNISLVVYYEVHDGTREQVKQDFNNQIVYTRQQNY